MCADADREEFSAAGGDRVTSHAAGERCVGGCGGLPSSTLPDAPNQGADAAASVGKVRRRGMASRPPKKGSAGGGLLSAEDEGWERWDIWLDKHVATYFHVSKSLVRKVLKQGPAKSGGIDFRAAEPLMVGNCRRWKARRVRALM